MWYTELRFIITIPSEVTGGDELILHFFKVEMPDYLDPLWKKLGLFDAFFLDKIHDNSAKNLLSPCLDALLKLVREREYYAYFLVKTNNLRELTVGEIQVSRATLILADIVHHLKRTPNVRLERSEALTGGD